MKLRLQQAIHRKNIPCISFCGKQGGDALIEALIGIILLAVIGLGLTYALSKSVLVQRSTNAQGIVVNEMREHVKTVGVHKLCDKNNPSAKNLALNGQNIKLNVDEDACQPRPVQVVATRVEGNKSEPLVAVTVPNRVIEFSISAGGAFVNSGDGEVTISHR